MKYEHLKINAEKSKQKVYDKLNKAYVVYVNASETKHKKLSFNKLSKLAGVDRSWVKKDYYYSIKQEVDAFNDYISKPDVKKTAEDVQANRYARLEKELKELRLDKEKLLQQNALYKIEADHFQQEAENKTIKIKKLQNRIASMTKDLNAKVQMPIEIVDFRK